MSLEKYILNHGDENNTWYVDVKGTDLDGNEVWMSGNAMPDDEAGFGGFNDFPTTIQKAFSIKKDQSFTPRELRYCSEDVNFFIPKEVYIGYAPLKGDNYQLWKVRVL